MITAEEILLKHSTTLTDETILCSHNNRVKAMKEFTNLHLDAAIKEWSEHLFRHNIEVETPMTYTEWLRHYKNRNNLK